MSDETNFAAARAFVEFGMHEKNLGRRESASGPGSTVAAASECMDLIDEVVSAYGVTSILDLGCGDWHWMRRAAWRESQNVSYEGWDAHPALIEQLTKDYGNDRTRFRCADITTTAFPAADLVICRDVLFHLPLELAARVVGQLKSRDCLLISTSFQDIGENTGIKPYLPIENWGFYFINLDIAPFGLQPYRLHAIREAVSTQLPHERSICLYRLIAEP